MLVFVCKSVNLCTILICLSNRIVVVAVVYSRSIIDRGKAAGRESKFKVRFTFRIVKNKQRDREFI